MLLFYNRKTQKTLYSNYCKDFKGDSMTENDKKWSDNWASIPCKPSTKKRIEALGKFGEKWDDILNKLADVFEEQRMDELTGNTDN